MQGWNAAMAVKSLGKSAVRAYIPYTLPEQLCCPRHQGMPSNTLSSWDTVLIQGGECERDGR